MNKEKRLGFVGVILNDREKCAPQVNKILSEFGDLIVGRMGMPYPEKKCWVITVIVNATTDEFGALTGKLGRLEGVIAKSALAPAES